MTQIMYPQLLTRSKVTQKTKLDELLSDKTVELEDTEKKIEDIESEGDDEFNRLPNLRLTCKKLQKQVNILRGARWAYASTKGEVKLDEPTETYLWGLVSNPNLKVDKDISPQVWDEVNGLLGPLLDESAKVEESSGLRQRFKSGG